MTLYRELKGQNGIINWQIKLKISIIAYTNNKGQAVIYLGVLVGIVGSMDTSAPSGSTIIIAVFLQTDEIKSWWIYNVCHWAWTCCTQRTSFSTTAGLQNGLRCWLVLISVIYRPRDVGGGTQQFFDITWAAVTTEKHLSRTNKGVLAVLRVYLSSNLYYNEKQKPRASVL